MTVTVDLGKLAVWIALAVLMSVVLTVIDDILDIDLGSNSLSRIMHYALYYIVGGVMTVLLVWVFGGWGG